MEAHALSASDSTALLPPDWSQFLPDVLVAGITGVLVGLAVLWVENRRARIREEEEAQRARLRATEAAQGTIDESFSHAYPSDSLLPTGRALKAIRRTVNAIPPAPRPRELIPAFVFLRSMVEQYEALPIAAERIETLIGRWVPSTDDLAMLRAYIRTFTYHPDQPWMVEKIHVHPNIEASMRNDRAVEEAVRAYGRRGQFLELTRQAFNDVDAQWRAKMWEITLREIKGAPRFPPRRWWRRRNANRERAVATEAAMHAGRSIMARGGTWFEPRGW